MPSSSIHDSLTISEALVDERPSLAAASDVARSSISWHGGIR